MVDADTLDFLLDVTGDAAEADRQTLASTVQRCGMLLAFTGLTTTLAGKDLLPRLPDGEWHDIHHSGFVVFAVAGLAGILAVVTGVLALWAMRPMTTDILSPEAMFRQYANKPPETAKFDIANSMVQVQRNTRTRIERRARGAGRATWCAVGTLVLTLAAAILKATL